ncbi:MAG: 2OG-Fe(II) oxygenase [Alphaproteobacteria bacterium]|jgi:hypothetical protein|nr:2OG-Fe(II) oxygenase [Alphaproteobacteria bacterium]
MATWRTGEALPLDAENLQALFDNEIPAIRIPGFATAAECRAFAAALRKCELHVVKGATDYSAPAFEAQRIAFIGLTQYEFKYRPMDDYLDAAEAARAEVAPVFGQSFDPVQRMMERLRALVGGCVEIARDRGGRRYSATIIRSSNEGLALHADFAPYQAPQLTVAASDAQLAWNFYAEVPGSEGGHTTLYDRPWSWQRTAEAEIAENYPLARAQVAGADSFTFEPQEGEVVMFNSRNPHEVVPVAAPDGKDRIAMATFIGRMPGGDLHLWS